MSEKRPSPSSDAPNKRKKSTFRFAQDSSESSLTSQPRKISSSASGRLRQKKQSHSSLSVSEADTSAISALDTRVSSEADTPAIDVSALSLNSTSELPSKPKRKKRQNTTSSRLQEWLQYRESTLMEMIRIYGLGEHGGNADSLCSCGSKPGRLRCLDCLGRVDLMCNSCAVKEHKYLPLHRIEEWNGSFFQKISLKELGLVIQLNHGGDSCPAPIKAPPDFLVFDMTGIHRVSVNFCGCQKAVIGNIPRRSQLLRVRWFPATSDRPKTVFTFSVLKVFHQLTLQSKVSVYDFYHSILRLNDPYELQKPTYRYPEFHRIFRVWRNLQALKHSARAHDPAGVSSTSEGELVLECPACPHPKKNLPTDWQMLASTTQFLYTLFLAVDANFKLKSKERGIKDFELDPGWGCYVEPTRYEAHIQQHVDEPEINGCQSDHDAIAKANLSIPGYRVNGTGLVLCSRHGLVRSNGVGDLPKGEKYCSMDYIVLSALIGITLLRVLISYDIGCQWQKNLRTRMSEYPEEMRLDPDLQLEIGIPSWHGLAHGLDCQINYSLNYLPGIGRTSGEDVETAWAHANTLAPSTREMGPGARRETLNDHWNGWNFRKIVGFRALFLKRFKDATVMRQKHADTFEQLSSTFEKTTLKKWEEMVENWIADRSKPNPYEDAPNTTTVQDIRLELAKEDAKATLEGVRQPHKTTLTSFLTKALEIEEQQRLLFLEVSAFKGKFTTRESADIQDKRNSLAHRIQEWREVQLAYTPAVARLLLPNINNPEIPSSLTEHPESQPLYLPSSVTSDLRHEPAIRRIAPKELRLRVAQADDSLAELRRLRRLITGLATFKKLNVSGAGNKPNTRMRTLYNRMQNKVERAAHRYRAARSAALQLDPTGGDWKARLRELQAADIRGPGRDPDDTTSRGRYEPSWIWMVSRASVSDEADENEEALNTCLRPEWTKAKARKDRWEEEWQLVQEEMRRAVEYHNWRARWWREQGWRSKHVDPSIKAGLLAYAEKQAHILTVLADDCVRHWRPALAAAGLSPAWATVSNSRSLLPLPGLSKGSVAITTDMVVDSDGEEKGSTDDEETSDEHDSEEETVGGFLNAQVDDTYDTYDLED